MLIAAFGSGWAVLGTETGWRSMALMAGIGILGAAVAGGAALARPHRLPAGLCAGGAAGRGSEPAASRGPRCVPGLVLGAACGLVVVGSRAMLVSLGGPTGAVQMAAAALAPLLVCGSVTWYVLLLLL